MRVRNFIKYASKKEESQCLVAKLKEIKQEGDVILLKASNGMKFFWNCRRFELLKNFLLQVNGLNYRRSVI